ncbi:MAG TPA: hypothetical protein VLE93_03470 [Candidatus Saccharimonadales bacterium]|nr:hypothetical protein [Candidatus Saccharimonadales bacterium]
MSYICQHCGQPQPNGTKPTKVIIDRQPIFHPPSHKKGWQIVKEENWCANCIDEAQPLAPLNIVRISPLVTRYGSTIFVVTHRPSTAAPFPIGHRSL